MTNIVASRPTPGSPVASTWGGEVHDAIELLGKGGCYYGNGPTTGLTTSPKRVPIDRTLFGDPTFLDATNHRLIIPAGAAGVYAFFLTLATPTALTHNSFRVETRLNGVDNKELGGGTKHVPMNSNCTECVSGMHPFVEGDYLEIWANAGASGGTAQAVSLYLVRLFAF